MNRDPFKMSKRDSTITKIEVCADAIKLENNRRKLVNAKAKEAAIKAHAKHPHVQAIYERLPMLRPAFVHTARRVIYSQNVRNVKGMDTVPVSNKRLCGHLGAMCVALDGAGIARPW